MSQHLPYKNLYQVHNGIKIEKKINKLQNHVFTTSITVHDMNDFTIELHLFKDENGKQYLT